MIYGTTDDKKEAIRTRAAFLRSAAASIYRLKPVIKAFDGKMYNKRFDEAIRAAETLTEGFYFRSYNRYNYFEIEFAAMRGSGSVAVMSGYTCIKGGVDSKVFSDASKQVFDGKKINADKMIALLNQSYTEILQEAYHLENAADNLETTLKAINDTKALLNRIIDGLPYEVRDICGLY